VKPTEAVTCPIKSHLDTPALECDFHCVNTCLPIVRSKTADASHPIQSVDFISRPRLDARPDTSPQDAKCKLWPPEGSASLASWTHKSLREVAFVE
jgi:hypothetical protein